MSELAKKLAVEFQDKEYAHAYVEEFDNAYIAAQIKALREQRNWTQQQLAERAGMKQERISALEDVDYDSWTLKTLRKLASAFDTALNVSFIPFSQRIFDITNLKAESLKVEDRTKDLSKFNPLVEQLTTEDVTRPTIVPVCVVLGVSTAIPSGSFWIAPLTGAVNNSYVQNLDFATSH